MCIIYTAKFRLYFGITIHQATVTTLPLEIQVLFSKPQLELDLYPIVL